MKPGRVVALVVGCLLLLPGIGMLLGGGALGLAYAFGRDDAGYFDVTLDRLESSTVAITTEDIALNADAGTPSWLLDVLDADVRLRITSADSDREIFVGIASQVDVNAYLARTAHDEVIDIDHDRAPVYRTRSGAADVAPPTEQAFWAASATGFGTQVLDWEATSGRWAVVVMNADGSTGVTADANVGVKAGFVLPLALILLGIGAMLTAGAVVLIVVGATRGGTEREARDLPVAGSGGVWPAPGMVDHVPAERPVSVTAVLDPQLSRWLWLVKWFLAIPHLVVLFFLWIAFFVLTVIAGFSILFTGKYPRGMFDFNVGVMRWSWRVSYYALTGGIGTDKYPPFSLGEEPDYPATLSVAYPAQLSRGLVTVKWWLLAIPHYLIVGVLTGGAFRWAGDDDRFRFDPTGGGGLLGLLVVIAGAILLFTSRYPRPLFDLILGFNRWILRVVAYAALMTDEYPPFRLDQGGSEPTPTPPQLPADVAEGSASH